SSSTKKGMLSVKTSLLYMAWERLFFDSFHSRKHFALHVFKQCTTACTHVTHVLSHTKFGYRSCRITTADKRECTSFSRADYSISDSFCPFGEGIKLKYPHWTVPK